MGDVRGKVLVRHTVHIGKLEIGTIQVLAELDLRYRPHTAVSIVDPRSSSPAGEHADQIRSALATVRDSVSAQLACDVPRGITYLMSTT